MISAPEQERLRGEMIFFAYIMIGAFAGFAAGLFGIGGGVIIVPALYFLLTKQGVPPEWLMHVAVASSLATVLATAISSTIRHHQAKAVMWRIVARLLPGILCGAAVAGLLFDQLDGRLLRYFFAAFEVMVALQLIANIFPKEASGNVTRWLGSAAGLVIGFCSTLLGIGGGTLSAPFFLWTGLNIRYAVATAAACGIPIACTGLVVILLRSQDANHLPFGGVGYIYWPAVGCLLIGSLPMAQLGAILAHRLPMKWLRYLFALLLGIAAFGMGI